MKNPGGTNQGKTSRLKTVWPALAVALGFCLALEAGFRIHLDWELTRNPDAYTHYVFSTTEAPLYLLDEKTGYSYAPNATLHFKLYGERNDFQRVNTLHTNNYGHIALEDDVVERRDGEFRIAVIGDSFSATPTSDVAWPTELERALNRDEALKKSIGKQFFKVINFGLDGTGLAQWPSVYENKVKPFHPDIVIVNFIWNDILRRFMYRRTVTIGDGDQVMIACSSLPAEMENKDCLNAQSFVVNSDAPGATEKILRIKRKMLRLQVSRLPWFSPTPEFLRMLLKGRFLGQSEFRIQGASLPLSSLPLYASAEEALAASDRAVREIASQQSALMLIYHPTLQECLAREPLRLGAEFMRRDHGIAVQNMLQYLPLGAGKDELQKWYNVPYDWHPSSYGARVYGGVVERRVAAYLGETAAGK